MEKAGITPRTLLTLLLAVLALALAAGLTLLRPAPV